MKNVLLIVFGLLLVCKLDAQERKEIVEPSIYIKILATSKISDETKIWEYDRHSGKWNSCPGNVVKGYGYFNVIKFLGNYNKLYYAFAYSKSSSHFYSIEGVWNTGSLGYISHHTHCFIITEEQFKTLKEDLFKKDGKTIKVTSYKFGIQGTSGTQEEFLKESTLKNTLKKIFINSTERRIFSLNSQIIKGKSVVRFTLPQQYGSSLKKFYFEIEMDKFLQFLID